LIPDHTGAGRCILSLSAIAKLFSSEAAFKAIDDAVQLFGGLGVVKSSACSAIRAPFASLMVQAKSSA
jgi:alkylation response protein AidB-like acyl-CoA dehydrogenase